MKFFLDDVVQVGILMAEIRQLNIWGNSQCGCVKRNSLENIRWGRF